MKKTSFLFAIILLCLITILPAPAHADTYGSLNYGDNGDGTCTVYGSSYTSSANIPYYINGLKVTHIAPGAFKDVRMLQKVLLSNSLRFIGEEAFYKAYDPNPFAFDFEMGNSIEYIGHRAFYNANLSIYLQLPETLTYIGVGASSYNSYTLPNKYGDWCQFTAYGGDTGVIYQGGAVVSSDYGYRLKDYEQTSNKDGTCTLTAYTGSFTNLELPGSLIGEPIRCLGEDVLASKNLTNIKLNPDLKYFGKGALANNNLNSVTLSDNIMEIGLGAFSGNNFDTFTLPAGDWFAYDENGFNGSLFSGGDSVSVDLGYSKTSCIPRRKSNVPATASLIQMVGDTYSLNLSQIFEDDYLDPLTYEVNIDGAGFVTVPKDYAFTSSEARDYTLIFRAFDGKKHSDDTYTVTITSRAYPSHYPTRKSGVPAEIDESIMVSTAYSLDLSIIFEDRENYDLSYQVDIDGAGYANTSSSSFSYHPSTVGEHTLVFRAYNRANYSLDTFRVNLTALARFKVYYHGNGAASGYEPESGNYYIIGSKVTVLRNTGALAMPGYAFIGWNTSQDGSGTHYDPGDTFKIYRNSTLFAEWAKATITSGGTYNIAEIPGVIPGVILTIATTEPVTLTGTAPGSEDTNGVRIRCIEGANLTLKNLTNISPYDALRFTGYNNKLFLDGNNTLESGGYYACIQVGNETELTIDNAPGKTGTLSALARIEGAGIGGSAYGSNYYNTQTSIITIKGGTITAVGGGNAAGIGGSFKYSGGIINITGGTIEAKGGEDAAGIGAGKYGHGGNITISGGQVDAVGGRGGAGIGGGTFGQGGNIIISGGDIKATGNAYAAGIGGGFGSGAGNVIISGGTVHATGGQGGAGIGSGDGDGWVWGTSGDGGTVTISGGDVTGLGVYTAAGIGGSNTTTVNITGGTVYAGGGMGAAGIGGSGEKRGGSITISGGEVTADGGSGGAGIGSGAGQRETGPISISNCTVIARGGSYSAGIGGAEGANGGTTTISGATVMAYSGGIGVPAIGCGQYIPTKGPVQSGNITIKDGAMVYAHGPDDPFQSYYVIGCGNIYDTSVNINQDIIFSGASTMVFTANGTRSEDFTLSDSIRSYSDFSDLFSIRLQYGLDTEPWNDANCLFYNDSLILVHIPFFANTADTVTNMPPIQDVAYGGKIRIPPAPSREGYVFDGWYKEAACINAWDFDDCVTSETASGMDGLYAKWIKESVIEISAETGGSVSPNGFVKLLSGEDLTVTISPFDDCTLDEITSTLTGTPTDNGDGTYTFHNITADGTINVSFNLPPPVELVYRTINIVSGGHGSVSPAGQFTIVDGASLTLTPSPDSGYMVGSLSTTAIVTGITQTVNGSFTIGNITSDGEVQVDFEPINYLVSITSASTGDVLPSGTHKVLHGSDVSIYPLPNTGYEVDAVTSTAANSGISSNANGSYTVSDITSAGTILVSYSIANYAVEVIAGDHGSVSPSGTQMVTYGNSLTITPSPDTGYEVDTVTTTAGNMVVAQSGGDYEIQNITEACTVNVTFKPIACTLTYDNNGGNGSIANTDVTYNENNRFKRRRRLFETKSCTGQLGYRLPRRALRSER